MSCKPSEKQVYLLFRGEADIVVKRKHPFALPFRGLFRPELQQCLLFSKYCLYLCVRIKPGEVYKSLNYGKTNQIDSDFDGESGRTLCPSGSRRPETSAHASQRHKPRRFSTIFIHRRISLIWDSSWIIVVTVF